MWVRGDTLNRVLTGPGTLTRTAPSVGGFA